MYHIVSRLYKYGWLDAPPNNTLKKLEYLSLGTCLSLLDLTIVSMSDLHINQLGILCLHTEPESAFSLSSTSDLGLCRNLLHINFWRDVMKVCPPTPL